MSDEISLIITNTTTFVQGRLKSEVYQGLKRALGYMPEDAFHIIQQVQLNPNIEKMPWLKDYDGHITTVCYNKAKCKCAIKKQGTHFPTGLASRAIAYFKSQYMQCKVYDKREKISKSFNLEMDTGEFEDREYQTNAINKACNVERGVIQAATGSGKCINENSLCLFEDGLMSFNEIIKENDLIFDNNYASIQKHVITNMRNNGWDKTSYLYKNGISNNIKIKTKIGFELEGTPNHRIRVLSSESTDIKWRRLKDIKNGDNVLFMKGTDHFGSNDILSEDDAFWFGLLVGDGCLTAKNRIALSTQDDHIIDFAKKYLESKKIKYSIYKDKRRDKLVSINIFNKSYKNDIVEMGCKNAYSYEKDIPLIVRKSPKKIVASFIKGLYEADGFCILEKSRVNLSIGLSNENLINQLQLMLLNFGITSHKRVKKTTHRDSHILSIYNKNVKLFLELIGLDENGYKYSRAIKGLEGLSVIENSNADLIPCVNSYVYTLLKEFKKFNKLSKIKKTLEEFGLKYQTVRSWSGDCAWRKPSRYRFKLFLAWANYIYSEMQKKELDSEYCLIRRVLFVLEIISSDSLFYNEVIEIKESVSRTYDFVVPESHSFLAQGMINHNTFLGAGIIAQLSVSPFIFYVTSIDLLKQAQDELQRFISYKGSSLEVGIIGDGKCNIRDVNIMTVQTAVRACGMKYKKFDSEEKKVKEKGVSEKNKIEIKDLIMSAKGIIFDECQHVRSDTCQVISNMSLSARYRYGMSATPWRDAGDDILIESCFGKTICNITASDLIRQNYLVKPDIYFVPMSNMRGKGFGTYATAYKEAIVDNPVRNDIIVQVAEQMKDNGRVILVLCTQIAHGKRLEKLIPDSVFIHGKHSSKVRKAHLDKVRARDASVTIASTIFDEGIDVKPLDTLILAGSGKSKTRALQRVGRVLRNSPGKEEATVIDFMDNCKYMMGHSQTRKKIYQTEPEFTIDELKIK
jgi:superfamily II DNA or RNA helicase/intein/homing endonuclease